MKASRLTAVGLVAAAGLWIASGHFLPHESAESRAAVRTGGGEAKKLFRVAVVGTTVVPHSRKLVVAGRTEADKRVTLTARTGGILTELRIKRGSWVQKGEIIAVLSDEAREAQVAQAEAVVTQKRTEIDAKRALILTGTLPRLQLVDLEAQVKAAEAALAGAAAERDRGVVRAPWSGVVHDVAVEVGQAAFSFAGRELATLVALDPMLAVVEVAERKLAGIKVGDTADVRLLTGKLPRLQHVDLEAQVKAAEAALAGAAAERDRGVVRAPWSGVVHDVAVEVGQAAFSFAGRELATLVALDPMLAVVEVAERKLAGIKVGDTADVRLVTGEIASGKIRFVAKTASQTTRTYRVEIELPNADGKIPDGITAEVAMPLSPLPATRIARSALTFSSNGNLGVRAVGADDTVEFVPVNVIEDDQGYMWVTGIAEGSRVIVQGQDFVREGQQVEAVLTPALTAVAR